MITFSTIAALLKAFRGSGPTTTAAKRAPHGPQVPGQNRETALGFYSAEIFIACRIYRLFAIAGIVVKVEKIANSDALYLLGSRFMLFISLTISESAAPAFALI